jgi:hypothetical protein
MSSIINGPKKLAIDLILRKQTWFSNHIDTGLAEITQVYEKYCQETKELFG